MNIRCDLLMLPICYFDRLLLSRRRWHGAGDDSRTHIFIATDKHQVNSHLQCANLVHLNFRFHSSLWRDRNMMTLPYLHHGAFAEEFDFVISTRRPRRFRRTLNLLATLSTGFLALSVSAQKLRTPCRIPSSGRQSLWGTFAISMAQNCWLIRIHKSLKCHLVGTNFEQVSSEMWWRRRNRIRISPKNGLN